MVAFPKRSRALCPSRVSHESRSLRQILSIMPIRGTWMGLGERKGPDFLFRKGAYTGQMGRESARRKNKTRTHNTPRTSIKQDKTENNPCFKPPMSCASLTLASRAAPDIQVQFGVAPTPLITPNGTTQVLQSEQAQQRQSRRYFSLYEMQSQTAPLSTVHPPPHPPPHTSRLGNLARKRKNMRAHATPPLGLFSTPPSLAFPRACHQDHVNSRNLG
ncbi:hypothetical protein V8C44DRAFT_268309 [Trichoderma aethiopicum]